MDPLAIGIILALLFCYYNFYAAPKAKASWEREHRQHEHEKRELREEIVRLNNELEKKRDGPTTPPTP